MHLNESHIEEAALTCFRELGYATGHGPHMVPGEPMAERDSFGELAGCLRAAVDWFDKLTALLIAKTRANADRFHPLADLCETLLPKLPSGELSSGQAKEVASV